MPSVPNKSGATHDSRQRRQIPARPLAALLALFALSCDHRAPAPPPPPPTAVTTARPLQAEVIEWDTYTGYLEAPESSVVAARVSGLILKMPFAEGSIVKRGDVLAIIDNRPFKADLDAKLSEQKRAEAQRSINLITLTRLKEIRKTDAIAQQDVDNAQGTYNESDAAVAVAEAAVELSRLNLEWCTVLSPIDGRVSDKQVTVGNLVNGGAGQATTLTTIQSVTPMYCYVDVDENAVLKYQRLAADGKIANTRGGTVTCYVQLADETGFPHEGTIDFVDNRVDPTTGTQRYRGVLNNGNGLLTPGFFARLAIPASGRYKAILVPDTAVGNDQDQRTVMVVDKENKVEARRVQTGALFGKLRSITSGLKPEDRLIVNGQMRVRPGAIVAPTDTTLQADPAAFAGPSMRSAMPTTAAAPAGGAVGSVTASTPTERTTGSRP